MTIAQQLEQRGLQQGMQLGLQQGMQQGMQQGEYSLLSRQLERKFGPISGSVRERLLQADAKMLLVWGERVFDAQTIDDIFN